MSKSKHSYIKLGYGDTLPAFKRNGGIHADQIRTSKQNRQKHKDWIKEHYS